VRVTRKGTGEQIYVLDNFTLTFAVPEAVSSTDLDADGLPDYWEQTYYGDPTNAVAEVDSDLDRMRNLDEFIAGTDPLDPDSFFRIAGATRNGDHHSLWFDSVPGRVYEVGWKAGPLDPGWNWTANEVGGIGGFMDLSYTNSAARSLYGLRVRLAE